MNKVELVKAGAKMVVSFGVGTIVTNAVSFTTPTMAMGILRRVAIGVGSFAMSAFVSEKLADYTDEKIDELLVEAEKLVTEETDSANVRREATA